MFVIFLKEVYSFFDSLIAYLIVILFISCVGLFVWVFPQSSVLEYGYADLTSLFQLTPYIFLFLIPAISMRSFSEEYKMQTMEFLATKPISTLSIVLSKYLACLLIVFLTLLPTGVYYFTLYDLAMPVGNIDTAAILGSYLGLFCLAAGFCAVGIFTSSLSNNQIIAFMLSVFLCFIAYEGIEAIAELNLWSKYLDDYLDDHIIQFGMSYHYQAMSKGLIDSRNLVYFFSLIIIFLKATEISVRLRKG